MKDSQLINGETIKLSQTVAQLYDDVIEAFLDSEEICSIQMACSQTECVVVERDAVSYEKFGRCMDMPQSTIPVDVY